jgi:predicted regulator of Ras-like GTPase activity (Roadblock/LC7/MglB family)
MAEDNDRTDEVPAAKALSKDDQSLRDQQLHFYSGDVKRINVVLDGFLKKSNSRLAMLITQGGHMVTKVGAAEKLDTDTVAALVSGAFAATKKLFEVFKEHDFALTVQKGRQQSVYIGLVGKRSLLTVLFDDSTTQGAVQLYATDATKKLEEIYAAIDRGEGSGPGADEQIGEDFGKDAGGALDNVFG